MEEDELVEQYLRKQYVAHKARLDAMFEERPSYTVRQLDRDLEMTDAMLRLLDDSEDEEEEPDRSRIEAEVQALEALLDVESGTKPVVRGSLAVVQRTFPPCPPWCVRDHADEGLGAEDRFCTTEPIAAIGSYGFGPEPVSVLVERFVGEDVQYSICVRGREGNIEFTVDEARKLAAALLRSAKVLDATT